MRVRDYASALSLSVISRDDYCHDDMRVITEAEHVHSSSEQYFRQFEELKMRLGMECGFE